MERMDTKDMSWRGWIRRIYHGKGGYKGCIMERIDTKDMSWWVGASAERDGSVSQSKSSSLWI
jgi:hypothetical protein